MSEDIKIGGGHYTCPECGETIFGSVVHRCKLKMNHFKPRRGAIAICSLGRIGLITSDSPIEVTYNDGNKGISWVGIQLTNGKVEGVGGDKGKIIEQIIGQTWMSRNPKVIGYIEEVIDILLKVKQK